MKNTKEKNYHLGHKAVCSACGSGKVRGQYIVVTKFQYRYFSCYWAGNEPNFILFQSFLTKNVLIQCNTFKKLDMISKKYYSEK